MALSGSSPAWAQTATPSPDAGTADGPMLTASLLAVTLMAAAAAVFFLAWALPIWADGRRAYRAQQKAWATIITRLEKDAAEGKDGLTLDELREFTALTVRPAEGTPGLSRVLLAFSILGLVAVITLALFFASSPGVFDVIKQIVTALLGLLATIIGFYFGAKATGEATAAATAAAPTSTSPSTPGTGQATTTTTQKTAAPPVAPM